MRWEEEWTLPPLRAKFPGAMTVDGRYEGAECVSAGDQHLVLILTGLSRGAAGFLSDVVSHATYTNQRRIQRASNMIGETLSVQCCTRSKGVHAMILEVAEVSKSFEENIKRLTLVSRTLSNKNTSENAALPSIMPHSETLQPANSYSKNSAYTKPSKKHKTQT